MAAQSAGALAQLLLPGLRPAPPLHRGLSVPGVSAGDDDEDDDDDNDYGDYDDDDDEYDD